VKYFRKQVVRASGRIQGDVDDRLLVLVDGTIAEMGALVAVL